MAESFDHAPCHINLIGSEGFDKGEHLLGCISYKNNTGGTPIALRVTPTFNVLWSYFTFKMHLGAIECEITPQKLPNQFCTVKFDSSTIISTRHRKIGINLA